MMAAVQQVVLTPYTAGVGAYTAFARAALPHGQRVMLIGGHNALLAGEARLIAAIRGTGLHIVGRLVVGPPCSMAQAQQTAQAARDAGAQMICGMGGGKAIDIAKAAGELAGLPVFAMPTIAATCAAVTALSVMYHPDGAFDRFLFLSHPPVHAYIDMDVMAAAPWQYLRAGLGDSLAKHVETPFSARSQALTQADSMGVALAQGLWAPLAASGAQALADNRAGIVSPALELAALTSIVTVGYVSLLVREQFNGALAHSLYYAMEHLPAMQQVLHGDAVGWGALVQLVLDEQMDKAKALLSLLRALGTPCSLGEMGIEQEDAAVIAGLRAAVGQPDMACLPYAVTADDVLRAVAGARALAEEAVN
ncbi:MAG: iron-containing alcohol dehydrogenase family protein [Clostridiales bacterium]|nr:iron-containing alcohol dehydrogenase family protein [Clostridiales bacterium]